MDRSKLYVRMTRSFTFGFRNERGEKEKHAKRKRNERNEEEERDKTRKIKTWGE